MKRRRSFTLALSGSSIQIDVAYLATIARRLILPAAKTRRLEDALAGIGLTPGIYA